MIIPLIPLLICALCIVSAMRCIYLSYNPPKKIWDEAAAHKRDLVRDNRELERELLLTDESKISERDHWIQIADRILNRHQNFESPSEYEILKRNTLGVPTHVMGSSYPQYVYQSSPPGRHNSRKSPPPYTPGSELVAKCPYEAALVTKFLAAKG